VEVAVSDHHHVRAVTVIHDTWGASFQTQANQGGKQHDHRFLTPYMDASI